MAQTSNNGRRSNKAMALGRPQFRHLRQQVAAGADLVSLNIVHRSPRSPPASGYDSEEDEADQARLCELDNRDWQTDYPDCGEDGETTGQILDSKHGGTAGQMIKSEIEATTEEICHSESAMVDTIATPTAHQQGSGADKKNVGENAVEFKKSTGNVGRRRSATSWVIQTSHTTDFMGNRSNDVVTSFNNPAKASLESLHSASQASHSTPNDFMAHDICEGESQIITGAEKDSQVLHNTDGTPRPIRTLRRRRVLFAGPTKSMSQFYQFEGEPGFSRANFTFEAEIKKAETEDCTKLVSSYDTVQPSGPVVLCYQFFQSVLIGSASPTDGKESTTETTLTAEFPSIKTAMELDTNHNESLVIAMESDDSSLPMEGMDAKHDAKHVSTVFDSTQTPGDFDVIKMQGIIDSQSEKIQDLESRVLGLEREKSLVEEKLKKTEGELASAIELAPFLCTNTQETTIEDQPSPMVPMVADPTSEKGIESLAAVAARTKGIALEDRKKELFDSQGFTEEDLPEPGDAESMSNMLIELAEELDEKMEANSKAETKMPPTRSEWRLQTDLSTEVPDDASTTPPKSEFSGTGKKDPLRRGSPMNTPPEPKTAASQGSGKSSFLTFRKVMTYICIFLAFGAGLAYLNGISFKSPFTRSPNLNIASYSEEATAASQPIYNESSCLSWSNGSSELNDMVSCFPCDELIPELNPELISKALLASSSGSEEIVYKHDLIFSV
ncbi:hypothetical protein IFR05_001639 [Cadophora sp. M221]|nr:hypothetical protein IFR05_001639 [Cadophora sp. M221]